MNPDHDDLDSAPSPCRCQHCRTQGFIDQDTDCLHYRRPLDEAPERTGVDLILNRNIRTVPRVRGER